MGKNSTIGKKTAVLYIVLTAALIAASICLLLCLDGTAGIIAGVLFAAAAGALTILFIALVYLPTKKLRQMYVDVVDNKKYDKIPEIDPIFSETKNIFEWIGEIVGRQKEIEMESLRTELMLLQNQINPHFLYNTLESIRSDALYAGLDSLAETARTLATFFRYTISESKDVYPVSYEIANIENYFAIQRYRFGDKLKLKIEFSSPKSEIIRCMMPKLTLQPLVENAIQHGLDPKSTQGVVTIQMSLTQNRLIILVRDNGVGISEDKVSQLNESLRTIDLVNNRISTVRHGVALRNVNHRIKLLFGEEYGLRVFSTLNIGAQVQITLPIVSEESYANYVAAEKN